MTPPGRPGTTSALLFGGAVAFVVGVWLVRAIRPALLLDPEPAWLLARLFLWLALFSGTISAGGLAAGLFLIWSRDSRASDALEPLSLRTASLIALAALAILGGSLLRFCALEQLPRELWVDDLSVISPTLALEGKWSDFADSTRPAPYGFPNSRGTVGVLYLELFRGSLRTFGTTVFGVRFPSALAGSVSVVTAILLGRALLPRGGGTLAGLVIAGLRWHLILSRWAWIAIALVPVLDLATLTLIRARRLRSAALAAVSGLVAGVAAHFYLSSWIAGAALAGFAGWPTGDASDRRVRARLAVAFLFGFGIAAAPLFLLREHRSVSYFSRLRDSGAQLRNATSPMPALGVVADSFTAPWFTGDPVARHDLPGRSRLGLIVGLLVAAALARSLLRPRDELSGLFFTHSAAALGASFLWGPAGHPNGYRFAYLTTVTAVAAAAGTLLLVRFVPRQNSRSGALAAVGFLALAGAFGARSLGEWGRDRATFEGFSGEDTLIGRAAARWDTYGIVRVESGLGRSRNSDATIEAIRRFRLDPDRLLAKGRSRAPSGIAGRARRRTFRVVRPGTSLGSGERVVERVRDGWGREWAVVIGSVRPSA